MYTIPGKLLQRCAYYLRLNLSVLVPVVITMYFPIDIIGNIAQVIGA